MTLIETIAALMLLFLVAAVSLSVYTVISRAVERQTGWRGTWAPAVDFLDTLAGDLRCAVQPQGLEGPAFALVPRQEGTGTAALVFYTTVVPDGRPDPAGFRIDQVAYHAEPDPDGEGLRVERTARPLGTPDAEPERRRLRAATGFSVEVSVGGEWTEAWRSDAGGRMPGAARIGLGIRSGARTHELRAATAIPAGLSLRAAARKATAGGDAGEPGP